jgi:hypothetical protein
MYIRAILSTFVDDDDVMLKFADVEADDGLLLRMRQEDLMQLVQDYVWILRGKSHEVAMLEREHGQDFWSQREDSWQSRPDGFWMKLLTEIVRNNYEEYKDSHKVAAGIVHGLREVEIQLDAAKLNLSGQETTKHNKSKPVAPFYMPPYPPRPDPELRQFSLSILHRDTQLIHKVTGKSASAPPAPAPRSSPSTTPAPAPQSPATTEAAPQSPATTEAAPQSPATTEAAPQSPVTAAVSRSPPAPQSSKSPKSGEETQGSSVLDEELQGFMNAMEPRSSTSSGTGISQTQSSTSDSSLPLRKLLGLKNR